MIIKSCCLSCKTFLPKNKDQYYCYKKNTKSIYRGFCLWITLTDKEKINIAHRIRKD